MMPYGWPDANSGSMATAMLLWGFVILAIIAMAVFAVRRADPAPSVVQSEAGAILDGRLARGEIDEAQFQRLRALIQESTAAPR